MQGLLGQLGGFKAPPRNDAAFAGMSAADGQDLFRLMSKASKYSGSTRKHNQKKSARYGYMAGQMMQQSGVTPPPQYAAYAQAAQAGGGAGLNPAMVGDFRSGKRNQQRRQRREKKGRYANREEAKKDRQGRKAEEGSMFDFFDSDTSSSSSSSDSD